MRFFLTGYARMWNIMNKRSTCYSSCQVSVFPSVSCHPQWNNRSWALEYRGNMYDRLYEYKMPTFQALDDAIHAPIHKMNAYGIVQI